MGDNGFVLLEGLLAALLLGVGILGMAGLQVAALAATGEARLRLEAQALAVSTLEQALGEARVGSGGNLPPAARGRPGPLRLQVEPLAADPGPGLRVRVRWTSGPGRVRSVTLVRLLPAGAVQPGAIQPGAIQPGAIQPGAIQPGDCQ